MEINSIISPDEINNEPNENINKVDESKQTFNKPSDNTTTNTNIIKLTFKKPEAYLWNGAQVKEWFNEKDIHSSIIDSIVPCNGKLLYEIYMIKKEAPEYFYSSFASSRSELGEEASFRDMAIFSYELRNLFENNIN